LLDLGEPGDHAGVDRVGLLHPAHAEGELAHRARVKDGYGKALFREQGEGLLFIAAGGLHGHQFHLVSMAKIAQGGDAGGVVGETGGSALAADARRQSRRGNIHSTNHACHGNLPCMCD
jgi:hypothetical protein